MFTYHISSYQPDTSSEKYEEFYVIILSISELLSGDVLLSEVLKPKGFSANYKYATMFIIFIERWPNSF